MPLRMDIAILRGSASGPPRRHQRGVSQNLGLMHSWVAWKGTFLPHCPGYDMRLELQWAGRVQAVAVGMCSEHDTLLFKTTLRFCAVAALAMLSSLSFRL